MRRSQAERQPVGESPRQAGGAHVRLDRGRCRTRRGARSRGRLAVEDEIATPGVAVARLADAARVEQRPVGRRASSADPLPGLDRRDRGRRPRSRPIGTWVWPWSRAGLLTRRGWRGRPARSVTYSRSGSRGLPWTRVTSPIDASLRQGREPRAGRRRTMRVARPLDGRARLRVEPLDLRSAERGGVVVAAHADRPAFGRAVRRRRPARGRSRRRRRGARWHRRRRHGRGPRRGPRGCCGCPIGRRRASAVRVAARPPSDRAMLTTAVARGRPDRAGSRPGPCPAAVAHRPGVPGEPAERDVARPSSVPPPSAVDGSPRRPRARRRGRLASRR